MTDLPLPAARRLARPRWLDARLVVGVLLVLGSVVLGSRVVAAADDTYEVWALRADLGAATTIEAGDLEPVPVHLGDAAASKYLSTSSSPVGWVLTRPLSAGELLPGGALAAASTADLRRVVLEVDRVGAVGLVRGRTVDVYAVAEGAPGEQGETEPPALVVAGVTVAELSSDGGGLSAGSQRVGVTLLVSGDSVPDVLAAQEGDRLVLVQVPHADERRPQAPADTDQAAGQGDR